MKYYTVYFSEPVRITCEQPKWDKEAACWRDVVVEKYITHYTTSSLRAAKKMIKANLAVYKSSSIDEIVHNNWVRHGEIQMSGRNSTTKNTQTVAAY